MAVRKKMEKEERDQEQVAVEESTAKEKRRRGSKVSESEGCDQSRRR